MLISSWYPKTVHHSKNLSFDVMFQWFNPQLVGRRKQSVVQKFRCVEGSTVLLKSQKSQEKKDRLGDSLKNNLPATCFLWNFGWSQKDAPHPTQATEKGTEKDSEQKHEKTSPFWWIHVTFHRRHWEFQLLFLWNLYDSGNQSIQAPNSLSVNHFHF